MVLLSHTKLTEQIKLLARLMMTWKRYFSINLEYVMTLKFLLCILISNSELLIILSHYPTLVHVELPLDIPFD